MRCAALREMYQEMYEREQEVERQDAHDRSAEARTQG